MSLKKQTSPILKAKARVCEVGKDRKRVRVSGVKMISIILMLIDDW